MSSGVRCTPCAASVRGPKKPSDSRYATGVALCFSAAVFTSSSVSARWMMTGHALAIGELPGALQRRRVERVHRVRRDGRHDQIVVGELA